jgi:hypothetical protein
MFRDIRQGLHVNEEWGDVPVGSPGDNVTGSFAAWFPACSFRTFMTNRRWLSTQGLEVLGLLVLPVTFYWPSGFHAEQQARVQEFACE